MKLLIRSTLATACLLALALAFGSLGVGADPPADPPATEPSPAAGTEPADRPADQPTDPGSATLPQAIMCLIDADCADGSQISCIGTGSNCSTGTESCTQGGCSGSRTFVLCDGNKTVCPCDVGSCCSASTTCSDGSPLSCTGPGPCQQGSESCTYFDCNGTRNFVQCGATKQTCACDIGRCKPCLHSTGCTPLAPCTTQEECGPCGSCEFGQGSTGTCLCLKNAGGGL